MDGPAVWRFTDSHAKLVQFDFSRIFEVLWNVNVMTTSFVSIRFLVVAIFRVQAESFRDLHLSCEGVKKRAFGSFLFRNGVQIQIESELGSGTSSIFRSARILEAHSQKGYTQESPANLAVSSKG